MKETLIEYVSRNPLGLSPMSGICDGPFRYVCRHGGAGLLVAPMLAARHLISKPEELPQEQHFADVEHPIGIQIIASDPDEAFKASSILDGTDYDYVELNASCPSRRILAMGCGSALLPKPRLIREILWAMVEGAKTKPITLKIRLGFRSGNFIAVTVIQEVAGIPLLWVTVHSRYADQPFTHPADWAAIKSVVDTSPFPIIGNGGITDPVDAVAKMEENGVLAAMIGRGALGRPWVFAHGKEPQPELKSQLMNEHWHMQQEEYSPLDAVIKFRKHLLWYSRGHCNACEIRHSVAAIKLPGEVDALLAELGSDK